MHERFETGSCVSKKKGSNCGIEDLKKSQGNMNWSFEDGCLGDRCYATADYDAFPNLAGGGGGRSNGRKEAKHRMTFVQLRFFYSVV